MGPVIRVLAFQFSWVTEHIGGERVREGMGWGLNAELGGTHALFRVWGHTQ